VRVLALLWASAVLLLLCGERVRVTFLEGLCHSLELWTAASGRCCRQTGMRSHEHTVHMVHSIRHGGIKAVEQHEGYMNRGARDTVA
jgi:hypothetical protein